MLMILISFEFMKTIGYIKEKIEMKDYKKIKYCLILQIEHVKDEFFFHQSTYTERIT